MISYKTGDLLEFTEDAFGHGCNCQSTMGSGVAKAVRAKWSAMYEVADCKSTMNSKEKLGKFTWIELEDGKIGYNIYSQFDFRGRNVGKMDLDYGALERGVTCVCLDLARREKKTLALPLIGCGLAGGNWNVVEGVLNRISEATGIDITVYINNGFTIEQIRENDAKYNKEYQEALKKLADENKGFINCGIGKNDPYELPKSYEKEEKKDMGL